MVDNGQTSATIFWTQERYRNIYEWKKGRVQSALRNSLEMRVEIFNRYFAASEWLKLVPARRRKTDLGDQAF